ncbi:MAG: TolC family protein [Methylococcales bacterium]|nr:TolC family protein [Methylococcales bacterium]
MANRPDVREAEFQIEASKFNLKAARAAFFPNFNITATLGYQAFNPEFLFVSPASLAYSLMGTLVAPLINMNALKQSVEISNELYKYARASYLEVLIAQQSALQSKLELIDVLKKQRMSVITIYKVLGGGWR